MRETTGLRMEGFVSHSWGDRWEDEDEDHNWTGLGRHGGSGAIKKEGRNKSDSWGEPEAPNGWGTSTGSRDSGRREEGQFGQRGREKGK